MSADRMERTLSPRVFQPEVASVTAARHHLIEFLYDVPEGTRALAELLVSELATNVVRHAATPFSVRAHVTPLTVRVEVTDGTRPVPVVERPGPEDRTGRGTLLVSQVAESWGTAPLPDGKVVWFELLRMQAEPLG
jgi:anti-sigma regulatory factor (Ser/Thr protein kinase)